MPNHLKLIVDNTRANQTRAHTPISMEVQFMLNMLPLGSEWEHRNGTPYTIIGISNVYSTKPEYPLTVIYLGPGNRLWSRPAGTWSDSFTRTN